MDEKEKKDCLIKKGYDPKFLNSLTKTQMEYMYKKHKKVKK